MSLRNEVKQRLNSFDGIVYEDPFHITGIKAEVYKKEDVDMVILDLLLEVSKAYNRGFTAGYEKGSNNYDNCN